VNAIRNNQRADQQNIRRNVAVKPRRSSKPVPGAWPLLITITLSAMVGAATEGDYGLR
jgi:hypothetical protein